MRIAIEYAVRKDLNGPRLTHPSEQYLPPESSDSLAKQSPATHSALDPSSYLLTTTCYLWLTTHYLLPTAYYLWLTTHYLLSTMHCLLPTAYYALPTAYYL